MVKTVFTGLEATSLLASSSPDYLRNPTLCMFILESFNVWPIFWFFFLLQKFQKSFLYSCCYFAGHSILFLFCSLRNQLPTRGWMPWEYLLMTLTFYYIVLTFPFSLVFKTQFFNPIEFFLLIYNFFVIEYRSCFKDNTLKHKYNFCLITL